MDEIKSCLRAGYAERIITPPLGIAIPGYFNERISNGIINDLKVRAVAFDNGETKAIIFMADVLNVHPGGYRCVRDLVSEACGIPPECVYLHGTHTHTAVYVTEPGEKASPLSKNYSRWQHLQFRDCALEALEDLKPASVLIARGEARGVGFMRRYEYKDGTFKTNPPFGDPNLLRPAGTMDNSVQLVRIQRDGAKEILLVNFGTHPDTLGGCKFYTDWPGLVSEYTKAAFNGEVEVLCLNGCQGNSGSVNRMIPKEMNPLAKIGLFKSQRMARIISGEVMKIYDSAVPCKGSFIAGYKTIAKIGKNPHTPEEEPLALKVRDMYRELKDSKHPDLVEIRTKTGMSVAKANRICANMKNPEFFEIAVSGLQIGNLSFIGIPGEPFTEIGLGIKDKTKMEMTIVNCCTNGSNGYFPTYDAFQGDGYERNTSKFAWNCAELLIEAGLNIIDQMKLED